MKFTYESALQALQKRRKDISYFNEEFFNTFMEDRKYEFLSINCREKGVDHFANTRKTDFYLKNGPAYCEFLEVVHAALRRYRIDYLSDRDALIARRYMGFLSEEEARFFARKTKETYEAPFVCVDLVY